NNAGLVLSNGARFNNAGTFLAQNDVANDLLSGGGAPGLFTNSGTFIVDTPSPNRFDIAVPFANTGTVNVQAGKLALIGGDGGMTTGDFNLANGAVLEFRSGFTLPVGADVTGPGSVIVGGVNVTIGGGFDVPSIEAMGGIANFNVPLPALRTVNVSAGAVNFNTTDTLALTALTMSD